MQLHTCPLYSLPFRQSSLTHGKVALIQQSKAIEQVDWLNTYLKKTQADLFI